MIFRSTGVVVKLAETSSINIGSLQSSISLRLAKCSAMTDVFTEIPPYFPP